MTNFHTVSDDDGKQFRPSHSVPRVNFFFKVERYRMLIIINFKQSLITTRRVIVLIINMKIGIEL